MAYFAAALAASGLFVVAGRRSRQRRGVSPPGTEARVGLGMPDDLLWDEPELDLSDSGPLADAGAALRLALKRVAPMLVNRSIQAEVASSSGLLVRMRAAALTDLLEEMLTVAMHAAPASRMLLTAAAQEGSVAVSVTDDVPNADLAVRRAGVRGLAERVAERGGAVSVDGRPTEGTTILLRLDRVSEAEDATPQHEPAQAGLKRCA